MIKHSDIRKGIRSVLLSVTNSDMPTADKIAWENHEFEPPKGEAWIRETLLPGDERRVAFGTLRAVGIMQYDLFWPADMGTERGEDLMDDIKDAFKPDTPVGTHAVVWRAERLPASSDERWYIIPIRLTWRAHDIDATIPPYTPYVPPATTTITDEADSVLLDELSIQILEDA